MISKEDFNKVWKDSTREDILTQFYYERNDLRELLKENGNKEEVIKRQQKVIEQLTNNWDELEEWLYENESFDDYCNETTFTTVLDKMKEIQNGSKDDISKTQ